MNHRGGISADLARRWTGLTLGPSHPGTAKDVDSPHPRTPTELPPAGAATATGDFMRWTTYQRVDRSGAARLASDVASIADSEQLAGHALAARAWQECA